MSLKTILVFPFIVARCSALFFLRSVQAKLISRDMRNRKEFSWLGLFGGLLQRNGQ